MKDQTPRLIAFHLPQFHAIPENDAWWGKGFTEWTNVRKAKPLFSGHYQPHVPGQLGHYNLLDPEVRTAQANLARAAGIHGFCYYHYWFNGKLLLEQPLHDLLELGEPDFPFCLCWANEPWNRSWDGRSDDILIDQTYSNEDDRRHMAYLKRFFQDSRYIRIDDKPLLLVYKANNLPDPLKTTKVWRDYARQLGIGELYLCRVEFVSENANDPQEQGFDAAVEFEPDWENMDNQLVGQQYRSHSVYRYSDVVAHALAKPFPSYKHFPCVFPSWDNSPRRQREALIILDSTSEQYRTWLSVALQHVRAKPRSEQIVFINAWNEWGESNHLEPDQRSGMAYLNATREALQTYTKVENRLFYNTITKTLRQIKDLRAKIYQTRSKLAEAYKYGEERDRELKQRTAFYKAELQKIFDSQKQQEDSQKNLL